MKCCTIVSVDKDFVIQKRRNGCFYAFINLNAEIYKSCVYFFIVEYSLKGITFQFFDERVLPPRIVFISIAIFVDRGCLLSLINK